MHCGGSFDVSTWTASWSERSRRITNTTGSIESRRRRASECSRRSGGTIHGASSATTSHPVSTSSSRVSRPKASTRIGSDAAGMNRRSRTSSVWSERAASIRAERAESSRPSCSMDRYSIKGSKSSGQNRNGRAARESGESSKRTSSPNQGRSPPPSPRDRPKVLEELGPLVVLRDLRARGPRELQAGRAEPRFPRNRERPREGFVRVGEGEVTDLARLADLEGTLCVVEGGLRSTEHGVHARDLPLPDGEFLPPSHDAPVVAGRVGHVDHRVVLLPRTPLLFEQDPGRIEQMGRHLSVPFGVLFRCHAGLSPCRGRRGAGQI